MFWMLTGFVFIQIITLPINDNALLGRIEIEYNTAAPWSPRQVSLNNYMPTLFFD